MSHSFKYLKELDLLDGDLLHKKSKPKQRQQNTNTCTKTKATEKTHSFINQEIIIISFILCSFLRLFLSKVEPREYAEMRSKAVNK